MSGAYSRRQFIKDVAAYGTAAFAAARLGEIATAQGSGWKNRIGLELYTVRDQMAKDFEGVLAKVAAVGYTEISGAGAAGVARGAPRPPGPLPPGAYVNPGTGVVHNSFTEAEAFGPYQPPKHWTA